MASDSMRTVESLKPMMLAICCIVRSCAMSWSTRACLPDSRTAAPDEPDWADAVVPPPGFFAGEVDGEHLGNPHHPITHGLGRLGCPQDEDEVVDVAVRGLERPRGHGAAAPVAGLGPEDGISLANSTLDVAVARPGNDEAPDHRSGAVDSSPVLVGLG